MSARKKEISIGTWIDTETKKAEQREGEREMEM